MCECVFVFGSVCFVSDVWDCWINIHLRFPACTVCLWVCVCASLAETLLWHHDSLCPLRLLRRQLVQRSSHQHDKHHPDQTHAYLLSHGQDSRADRQKKLVHSLCAHRKKCVVTLKTAGARDAPTLLHISHYVGWIMQACIGINPGSSLYYSHELRDSKSIWDSGQRNKLITDMAWLAACI